MAIPYQGEAIDKLLKGIDTGSSMFQRMMAPVISREQMAIQQQQQNRLQQAFEQQMKDRNYLESMMNGQVLGAPHQGSSMPTQEFGQGMGMFTPQGIQQRQQQQQQQQSQNNNWYQLRNNPKFRGIFKNVYGYDPALETPEEKEAHDIRVGEAKEQNKQNIKTRTAIEEELPESERLLKRIESAIPLVKENKDLFGPGVGGVDFFAGPNQRYRGLKDPKKIAAFKELSTLFASLQGKQASDFSSRSMKVAFDLAEKAKTTMADHPEAVVQVLNNFKNELRSLIQEDRKRYKNAGGKGLEEKELTYNPKTGRLE